MKTPVDIAESCTDLMFEALVHSTAVVTAIPAGAAPRRKRHVIDAAAFEPDGSVTFDGEFDFHYGDGGDEVGHAALRANVTGHLVRDASDEWRVGRLQVESLQTVDAGRGPDQLP